MLFRREQRQRGVAIRLRNDFRQVVGHLQFQDAIEVILRRRRAEPVFQVLDTMEQRFIFEFREPAQRAVMARVACKESS